VDNILSIVRATAPKAYTEFRAPKGRARKIKYLGAFSSGCQITMTATQAILGAIGSCLKARLRSMALPCSPLASSSQNY